MYGRQYDFESTGTRTCKIIYSGSINIMNLSKFSTAWPQFYISVLEETLKPYRLIPIGYDIPFFRKGKKTLLSRSPLTFLK